MQTQNLDHLVLAMQSMHVSDDFLQGALFTLGGVLMSAHPNTSEREVLQGLQWVVPHDINGVSKDIIDRMYDDLITRVVEELFYRLGVEIPLREICIDDIVIHLCTPADHGKLPEIDLSKDEMHQVSRLYFAAVEEFGRCLKKSNYSRMEAYQAGICFFSSWLHVDRNATGFILHSLSEFAPPALKFIFAMPRIKGANPAGWLPTQIALWGFVTGLDETFMSVAWPFQSWMLYKDGNPIPGIEDLGPAEFFSHCYETSKHFAVQYESQIGQVADIDVGPDNVPIFTGTASERTDIFSLIKTEWGYDPTDQTLPVVEQKQVNACLIFVLFCSLCRAYRAGLHFANLPGLEHIKKQAPLARPNHKFVR